MGRSKFPGKPSKLVTKKRVSVLNGIASSTFPEATNDLDTDELVVADQTISNAAASESDIELRGAGNGRSSPATSSSPLLSSTSTTASITPSTDVDDVAAAAPTTTSNAISQQQQQQKQHPQQQQQKNDAQVNWLLQIGGAPRIRSCRADRILIHYMILYYGSSVDIYIFLFFIRLHAQIAFQLTRTEQSSKSGFRRSTCTNVFVCVCDCE